MTEIIGYAAAVLIGLSLGLIGGGGSILTVPVLVYLFHVDTVSATSFSLFVVGVTALVGAAGAWRKGLIDLPMAAMFGAPSIVAVWVTRKFIMPMIPLVIELPGGHAITKPMLLMGLFALLMLGSATAMIRGKKGSAEAVQRKTPAVPMVILEGTVVGVLTGLVGAGGGFLIIPALVVMAGLEMKVAVGTSLLIIASKSLIGFTGDLGQIDIQWALLGSVTVLAIIGLIIGQRLSDHVSGDRLKPAFGWFTLVMGLFILTKELT
jgi:uncharacterized membrane protein YfcA